MLVSCLVRGLVTDKGGLVEPHPWPCNGSVTKSRRCFCWRNRMATALKRLLTVGEIARLANSDVHRVEYYIRSRGIQPLGMAGNARVFDEKDATKIISGINMNNRRAFTMVELLVVIVII